MDVKYNQTYSMVVCVGLSDYNRVHFSEWLVKGVIQGKRSHYLNLGSVSEKDKVLFRKVIIELIKGYVIISADATQMEVQELRDALRRASAIFFGDRLDGEHIHNSVKMVLGPSSDEGLKRTLFESLTARADDPRSEDDLKRLAGYFADFCCGSKDIIAALALKYSKVTKKNDELIRDLPDCD